MRITKNTSKMNINIFRHRFNFINTFLKSKFGFLSVKMQKKVS